MTRGLKLTLLGRHQLANLIFFSQQMEKCGHQKVSIKFFLHSETQKHEDVSLHESIP